MKIVPFDPNWVAWGASNGSLLSVYSGGSNSATGDTSGGGDVVGSPGDYTVVGLRRQVSLASNIGGTAIGDVLTIVQTSPRLAMFATPSNSGSTGSNALLRTTGGAGQVTTISTSGSAQTLMVGGANYFDVTLTANCVFTFTGWAASGAISEIGVRTTENGTGGWTPTFTGVSWVGGGSAPTHTTTAGSSTEYVFWTDDAGATITGGQLAPGASVSVGSNSTRVREISTIGASTTLFSPFDHAHDGIGTITASSSNTMQRGTWNIRAGSGIALTLSDTDGDGEFDTTTIVNTGGTGGGGGGSPTIATVDATLSGDVTMTTANNFSDGPSASFAAGTWLIKYKAVFALATTGNTHDVTVKLWDGSTIYDESSNGLQVNNTSGTIGLEVSGFAIVTLGSPTTLKISATDVRNSTVMKRDVTSNSGSSHTATRLVGYKVS